MRNNLDFGIVSWWSGAEDYRKQSLNSRWHLSSANRAAENLRQTLYLNPNFRVVIETGGGSARESAMAFARVLQQSGCGDVPMAVIRSLDLLDRYEELFADSEVKLSFNSDEQKIRDQMPVAAHVEQDAEPIAAGLGQGAKVIFVERCPPYAPLIAAGRWSFADDWSPEAETAATATGYLLGYQRQGFEFAESILPEDQQSIWPVVELMAAPVQQISPYPKYHAENFLPAQGIQGLTVGNLLAKHIVLSNSEGDALSVSINGEPPRTSPRRCMIRYEGGWQLTAFIEWGREPESPEEIDRFLKMIRASIKPIDRVHCSYDLDKSEPEQLAYPFGVYANGLSAESSVTLARLIKSYDGDITCTRCPDDQLAFFDLTEEWTTWSIDLRPAADWVD